ncbi:MAG: def [Acidimicrobiia bacterium]|nr:def [Acidimicrobiia bacterium]
MSLLDIRQYGDPVLKVKTAEITDVDDSLVRLSEAMLAAMYNVSGLGLAAPQVGVSKRFFVYDVGNGPSALINPRITESDGEWLYDEGCLSIPGIYIEIVRPKIVHIEGYDLDGNEVSFEADELLGRAFQHELDHLDGVLMFDRITDEQRREALKEWRQLQLEPPPPDTPKKRLRFR